MTECSRQTICLRKKWDCNPTCPLCFAVDDITPHLLTECNYTEAAWNMIAEQWRLPHYHTLAVAGGPRDWVSTLLQSGTKKEREAV